MIGFDDWYADVPCGLLRTSPDGSILGVNATFLALTGYERDAVVGRMRFVDLLSAGGRIYHETHYAPMLQMHGSASEIALELVTKGEERLPVLVNSVLHRDADGAPIDIRTVVFEARDRRQYERELVRAKQQAEAAEARAMALARTLQQTLIPPAPPTIPQLDVAAEYRPAGDGTEVGGDFYDIFQLGTDEWVIVIGDVRGKGAEAAVVTALVRHTLRAATVRDASVTRALAVLNDVLIHSGSDRFCTVLLLRVRQAAGRWRGELGAAGHPLPFRRDSAGQVDTVGTPGTLLGVLADAEFHEVTIDLGPGEGLVLYTDGVSEARHGAEFYGEQRIRSVLTRPASSVHDLTAALLSDVLDFQAGTPRDDIAIVAVGVPPAI
jgi:sigma-B regulation protein RsbU (phosphoserine phosphatase)